MFASCIASNLKKTKAFKTSEKKGFSKTNKTIRRDFTNIITNSDQDPQNLCKTQKSKIFEIPKNMVMSGQNSVIYACRAITCSCKIKAPSSETTTENWKSSQKQRFYQRTK